MNFILKPSLEHMALIKVATVLWNVDDIRNLMNNFVTCPLFLHMDCDLFLQEYIPRKKREKWLEIEDKVIEKIPYMTISLKERLLFCIQGVGFQILRWLEYHRNRCHLDLYLPSEFSWTSYGIIDKKKTAEMLIKDESIIVITRYKLACIYCLENNILELWNKIPEDDRRNFYRVYKPSEVVTQHALVTFWTYRIKGESTMDSVSQELEDCAFLRHYRLTDAIIEGNKIVIDYFLQKLKVSLVNLAFDVLRERRESYRSIFDTPKEYYSEVFCFFLSQMNCEEQLKILTIEPRGALYCLLDWPWQCFFVEAAKLVFKFQPNMGNKKQDILRRVIHKAIDDERDCNYREIIKDVWMAFPAAHKSEIINDSTITGIMAMLLQIKDIPNIKLILQSASCTEKRNLILGSSGFIFCNIMINSSELNLAKFFVQSCIFSKDDLIRFKREFEELSFKVSNRNKDNFRTFLKFLDDFLNRWNNK